MPASTVASKICPVCHTPGVKKISGRFSFKGPTHRCEHCQSNLRVVATPSIWWLVPTLLICLGIAFALIARIHGNPSMSGLLQAVLIGAIVGLGGGICIAVAQRGLTYRPMPK